MTCTCKVFPTSEETREETYIIPKAHDRNNLDSRSAKTGETRSSKFGFSGTHSVISHKEYFFYICM